MHTLPRMSSWRRRRRKAEKRRRLCIRSVVEVVATWKLFHGSCHRWAWPLNVHVCTCRPYDRPTTIIKHLIDAPRPLSLPLYFLFEVWLRSTRPVVVCRTIFVPIGVYDWRNRWQRRQRRGPGLRSRSRPKRRGWTDEQRSHATPTHTMLA